jgi:hypothetical protein
MAVYLGLILCSPLVERKLRTSTACRARMFAKPCSIPLRFEALGPKTKYTGAASSLWGAEQTGAC